MTDVRDVWVQVFIAALPTYGIERGAIAANQACDEFNKRFSTLPQPTEPKKPEVKVEEKKP